MDTDFERKNANGLTKFSKEPKVCLDRDSTHALMRFLRQDKGTISADDEFEELKAIGQEGSDWDSIEKRAKRRIDFRLLMQARTTKALSEPINELLQACKFKQIGYFMKYLIEN